MARKQFDGTTQYSSAPPDPVVSAKENAWVNRQIALENAVRRVCYADSEEFLLQLWNDSTAAEDAEIENKERIIEEFLSSTEMDDVKSDHKVEVLREAKSEIVKVVGKWEAKSGDIDWRELEDDLTEALTG